MHGTKQNVSIECTEWNSLHLFAKCPEWNCAYFPSAFSELCIHRPWEMSFVFEYLGEYQMKIENICLVNQGHTHLALYCRVGSDKISCYGSFRECILTITGNVMTLHIYLPWVLTLTHSSSSNHFRLGKIPDFLGLVDLFFIFICFWRTSSSFLITVRRQIWARDCRTTVRHATTEPPHLPNWATMPVSPGIEPGGIVFPSQNNNIVLYSFGELQTMWELEIFSSAPGWFDDPLRVSGWPSTSSHVNE